MKNLILILSFTSLFIACKRDGYSQLKIGLSEYASGFSNPVDISNAGDGRLFIVEQEGRIMIIDSNKTVLSNPFLDIRSAVNSSGTEQGLLGLAFHPDYKNNGYFFVNYTGVGDSSRISRFSTSSGNPNLADPLSEERIITVYQPYKNHNGGELVFGPDGYLYIGFGDGGSGGDPQNRAQDSVILLGKMLRINVNGSLPYTIPSTNPFVGVAGIREEIWAIGLRNPWRFSFDRTTGDLWIADVGQSTWEEIDFQPSSSFGGENYGWRCYEGGSSFNTSGCLGKSNYIDPINQYSNTGFSGDCSITGGFVYRGKDYPNLNGYYFYADYCSDKIWSIHNSSGQWIEEFHGVFGNNNFSTFGEDYHGELYVAGLSSGRIFKIIDSNQTTTVVKHESSLQSTLFPNPFVDELNISIESDFNLSDFILLSISSLEGKELYQINLKEKKSTLNLDFLEPGLYNLTLKSVGKVRNYRIIKNLR